MTHLDNFDRSGTHRLIPAKNSPKSVLENLSLPSHVISDLSELDAATNERKIAERGGNLRRSARESFCLVSPKHIL